MIKIVKNQKNRRFNDKFAVFNKFSVFTENYVFDQPSTAMEKIMSWLAAALVSIHGV